MGNYEKTYKLNPKRDKRGLTKGQAKFVEKAVEVGPLEAAKIVYPDATPESQAAIAGENMRKPEIVSSISKLAESVGLGRLPCVETIKNGLEATKLYGKDSTEHPDHATRIRAAELGLKLHGELKEQAAAPMLGLTKEVFVALCNSFWETKPPSAQA